MKKVILIVTGMIITVLLVFGGLEWIGSQPDHSDAASQASLSKATSQQSTSQSSVSSSVVSESSSSAVAQSSVSATDSEPGEKLSTDDSSALDDLKGTRAEKVSTINNKEVTFSQFYRASGSWNWVIQSQQRGTIATTDITSINKQGNQYQMKAHEADSNVTDDLTVNVHSDGSYDLRSNSLNLHGEYGSQADNPDKIGSKVNQIIESHGEQAKEDPSTRNNGEVTYSEFYAGSDGGHWRISSNKRGTIEDGRIDSVEGSGPEQTLHMTSTVDPNHPSYTLYLQFSGSADYYYTIQTSYLGLQGKYEVPDD